VRISPDREDHVRGTYAPAQTSLAELSTGSWRFAYFLYEITGAYDTGQRATDQDDKAFGLLQLTSIAQPAEGRLFY